MFDGSTRDYWRKTDDDRSETCRGDVVPLLTLFHARHSYSRAANNDDDKPTLT